MSGKHSENYFQKYYIFLSFATLIFIFYACSSTKKVPDGEYLLVKNNFKFDGKEVHKSELSNYVLQQPNSKQLFLFPLGLWTYNMANPKYDTILKEYMTYPGEMRNQKLRDSLFIKYGHPEYVGKSLFWNRFFHNFGQEPVILDQENTKTSANSIRKRLVYRGYWDADTSYKHNLDSASKKAKIDFIISPKDATYISESYYDIPDPKIKELYVRDLNKSLIRTQNILDQTVLESEIKRINTLMRQNGYYEFNNSNQEIYFTTDTLANRKQVPLIMEIKKDTLNTPYKLSTIGDLKVFVVNKITDTVRTKKDSLRGITFYKLNERYKTATLWRPIILKTGEIYNQDNLDATRRNFQSMNNFSILAYREGLRKNSDSIIDVTYYMSPLPRYDLKLSGDVNYSQLMNIAVSPSVDLTTRNLFGGAQNLNTTVSWVTGLVQDTKDPDNRIWAHEFSANTALQFPKLLLPFDYYKVIPKRYSPTSSINLGASFQKNIGLERININTGLTFQANVKDVVTHRLTLFNTQLSLTRNKDSYYEYFTKDQIFRDKAFMDYSPTLYQQFINGQISSDDLSKTIMNDQNYQSSLSGDQLNNYNNFRQTLINKDKQTQDVLITSFLYNFIYNEIGKKEFANPFYFNGKLEVAGNIPQLLFKSSNNSGVLTGEQKTLFNVPFSQFVKFDFDIRKYFSIGENTLALRQFVGLGIPYGNSSEMPFVRSYFNGGSNDIRAWKPYGGLGPADSQLDERIRMFAMDNVKLTTSIEYRMPITNMYEIAAFTDLGNIWSLKNTGFGDEFKFNKFWKQMGVGSGIGLRINVAYITFRADIAYKVYDPNAPEGSKWRISKIQPLKPTLNIAFGYPF